MRRIGRWRVFAYRVASPARWPQFGWGRSGGRWSATVVVGPWCVSVYRGTT